jgi:glucose/arabinose dehydrogenase
VAGTFRTLLIHAALFVSLADASEAQPQLRARVYAAGFLAPVAFVQDPAYRAIQYVVEQRGRIRVVNNGTIISPDFLDLRSVVSSGGERGLLGMAFAPDYTSSRRFYVNFTDLSGNTVIARFQRSADNPFVADPSSRFDLRWDGADGPSYIRQPYSNHNGGHLAFGPDGFLYIGLGDGGSGNDPGHLAQNPAELLGKMLRIDVNVSDDHPSGYVVPPGNPFGGAPGTRPEIWSFGLRNPWRYSFDDASRGGTGALVIADVGQGRWEEIDYEPPNTGGRNYGWRNREGAHGNLSSPEPAFLPLIDPLYEYGHAIGQSVTGGYVYRGRALGPAYRGRYFFADLSGRVWSLGLSPEAATGEAHATDILGHTQALGGSSQLGLISSFGAGWDAELYIVSYSRGLILKIEANRTFPPRDGDFDADRQTDVTVFRPADGTWYLRYTTLSAMGIVPWGGAGDLPVSADYDGDGALDIAVFRPANGEWHIRYTSSPPSAALLWGGENDVPVPGDYDGDGVTDIAVFRRSNGGWYIRYSAAPTDAAVVWGGGDDIPVAADYDADGKTDVAVFRPTNGTWYIRYSGAPVSAAVVWGGIGDRPTPTDFDGDGKAEIALFRLSNGTWYIRHTATPTDAALVWGGEGDHPVPADFDGDGIADLAVFRPSDGNWYIRYSGRSTAGVVLWGAAGDVPIPRFP